MPLKSNLALQIQCLVRQETLLLSLPILFAGGGRKVIFLAADARLFAKILLGIIIGTARTEDVAGVDFVRHIIKITVDFVGVAILNQTRRLRLDADIHNIVAAEVHGVGVIHDDFRLRDRIVFVVRHDLHQLFTAYRHANRVLFH